MDVKDHLGSLLEEIHSTNQVEEITQMLVDQMAISLKSNVTDKGIYKFKAHDFEVNTKISKTGAT